MDCFGYETCDKLLFTPGECYRDKITTIKQGIPKINKNNTSPS